MKTKSNAFISEWCWKKQISGIIYTSLKVSTRATKCSISSFFPNACEIFVPLSKLNP